MRGIGIHILLIGAALILMSAGTGAFFLGTTMVSNLVEDRFKERISFLAHYLALNAELGVLIDDHAMLTALASNLLSQEDVTKIIITNNQGAILANVFKVNKREKKIYLDSVQTQDDPRSIIPGTTLSRPAGGAGEHFFVTASVKLKNTGGESQAFQWQEHNVFKEQIIGQVKIFYSINGINAMLQEIKNLFYLLSAGLLTLSLFIFCLLSRYLVLPVKKLALAARQVSKGDLTSRVKPGALSETKELAEAFNAMLNSLEQSNRALEEASQEMIRQKTLAEMGKFSLMIAHEVKNPLGIIKSSLDILKQDQNLSSENIMVSYIEDEIRRLNKLIEEFLEFARPASPNFRLTNMDDLLRECVMRFELQSQDFPAIFHLDLPEQPCFVHVDPDLLTRVFSNIVKNAIEIHESECTIDISAHIIANQWVCTFKDHGPGISSDDIAKIFKPFYTTRSKGSGLGLAFVSQVIKAHNGTVSAENSEEDGACFTLSLPIRESDTFDK